MSPTRAAVPVGIVQISLAGVLWGTGGITLQVISDRTPLSFVTVSGYRMLIAAVVLVAAVLVLRRSAELVALLRASPGTASLVGVGTGAYQALYFGAVIEVGVTVATVVSLGLAPVLLTAAEVVTDRRHPGARRILVVAVALVGLVLVSVAAGGTETGPRPWLGVGSRSRPVRRTPPRPRSAARLAAHRSARADDGGDHGRRDRARPRGADRRVGR